MKPVNSKEKQKKKKESKGTKLLELAFLRNRTVQVPQLPFLVQPCSKLPQPGPYHQPTPSSPRCSWPVVPWAAWGCTRPCST